MKRLVPVGTDVRSTMIFPNASTLQNPRPPNITLLRRASNLFMAINKDKPQVGNTRVEERVFPVYRLEEDDVLGTRAMV